MTKKNKDQSNFQWYIATTYSGREDSVVRDLQAKIKALNLDEDVKTIRVFKEKQRWTIFIWRLIKRIIL
jgi:transcription antitermination factor NusG